MSQRELDEAIAKIRSEQVEDETVKSAAKRVFGGLFDSAFIVSERSGGKIRGCEDMRALMPAYLNRTLPAARVLLLEDHALHCVDCRRALQQARGGEAERTIPAERASRKRVPRLVWAMAAALLVGIGLGVTGLLPGQNTVRAQVASVQGRLYRVTELGVSLVQVGQIINNSDELRTAKGSRAILRLAGGTQLEIAERSQVSLSGGWRGPAVNLERGQMIVEAHGSVQKALYVTSGEMTIPVTSGVVAVNHGTKESRIAVAQGLVDVQMGQNRRRVSAGQQYGGELRLANLPIASEFAWSQNADSYLALLKELSNLQKDLQAIPSPGLRYASRLPQYLPADTFVYAAIPNLGGTISEAKKLFASRLAESDVLRQWWEQKDVAKNGEFDRIVDQISSISSYLGDEIAVAISGDVAGAHAGPVFLAEIKQPGLAEYLRANLPVNADVQIVTAGASVAGGNKLFIEMDNNILVATPSAAQLKRVEDIIQAQVAGQFSSTALFERIGKVYDSGAGYFLAADLEQITAKSVNNAKSGVAAGLDNARFLVLERKESNGDTEMKAAVSFDGTRRGIASWLSAPSPAGSLDFVSPDASFAASLVMKNPPVMMQELISMTGNASPDFARALSDFESHSGISLLDDVAAPLGSDVTFALDGALLPVPAWKIAIEVYDATRLQQTLTTFVERFNQQAPAQAGHLSLSSEQINGRTFYALSNEKAPGLAAYYTYIDGYLLASSSEANVQTAIDNKHNGHMLADSASFRAKLPADGYPNFSAMVYSNMGSSLGDLAKQLRTSPALSAERRQSFSALLTQGGSGLVCVYGEAERITATARGSFLGFNLGTLIGIQQGQPLKTIIASAPNGAAKGIVN